MDDAQALPPTQLLTFAGAAHALGVDAGKLLRLVVEDKALSTVFVDGGGNLKPLDLVGLLRSESWQVDDQGRLLVATPHYEQQVRVRTTFEPVSIGELRIERSEVERYAETLQAPVRTQSAALATQATKPPLWSKTHRAKGGKTDPLTAVISLAINSAVNPEDWQSGWASLVRIADTNPRPPPLIGYVEGEGVKYEVFDGDNPVVTLNRESFRKRFERIKGRERIAAAGR